MNGDDYVEVECRCRRVTDSAVLLHTPEGEEWCPRSLLHGASDIVVRDAEPDVTVTLKIRRWKVEQLGL